MKHARLFILGASALALSQWANTARAESAPPGSGLEEISDAELGDMRGRYTTWTRIRVNLQHVPEAERPAQEPLDPDEKIFSSS